MLYNSFRGMMMLTAIIGIFHMIVYSSYVYIFFPIIILIWGLFSFFDENDKEFLRRHGIDPDEISWLSPEYTDYGYETKHHRRIAPARNGYTPKQNNWSYDKQTYTPYAQSYVTTPNTYGQEYKQILPKCKRNFKISVSKTIVSNESKSN